MNVGGVHDISEGAFLDLAEDMGRSTHPLILFAAGNAAVEAAHYSQNANRPPKSVDALQARLGHLEKASQYCIQASRGFADQKDEATDDKMRAEWFSLEMRAQQTLAVKPSLQVLTHWACGHEVAPIAVQEATATSMGQLLVLGSTLLVGRASDKYMRRAKNGLASELGANLLLQRGPIINNVVVPTSLRQDHHRKPMYRADLLAVSGGPPHQRTLIQVDTGKDKTHSVRAMRVKTKEDLTFDPLRPGKTVLHALIEASSDSADNATAERLDELSYKLIKRLV